MRDECERVNGILRQLPDRNHHSPTEVGKAFGEVARRYLEGVSYPAQREHLVAEARTRGAHQVVVDSLLMIPEREHPGADTVLVELIELE
ncbi:DUF2795 domain-containing protein [Streptosporangium sp. NPDC006013]|uniref:DUF2795 domain-containing protein n=1 Tax=Streptosporangium sp. NPDC006013 TaxID=3155596 RepID=UPI0033A38680